MNSWQQPKPAEAGGGTWHKVENPSTGWLSSKTSGWTADSFSGGLTVDFSAVVPAGTKAVRVFVYGLATGGWQIAYRKGSDSNISNTPLASNENSHRFSGHGIGNGLDAQVVFWLSSSYTVDIAVDDTDVDVYVAYPVEYLL